MARSQQQWRQGTQLLLVVAAVALVFLIAAGSADAVTCYSPYTKCGSGCYDLTSSTSHCGSCYHKCKLSDSYKYGEYYCDKGYCKSRCKKGWQYNSSGKYCYK